MKRFLTLFLLGLLLFSLTACAPAPEVKEPDVEPFVVDLVPFSSLEEFDSAVKAALGGKAAQDLADLSSLSTYYVPDAIPKEYVLGKITAGAADIMFWYYPADSAATREGQMRVESVGGCFEFMMYRLETEDPLAMIMKQLGKEKRDLVDGKYLYDPATVTWFWVENGTLLSLKRPTQYVFTSKDGMLPMCSAKAVTIS